MRWDLCLAAVLFYKDKIMAKVIIHRKEDFERAFKQFKMRCKREGILKEYREKQHYTKPSEKKRRAMKKKK